MRAVDSSGGDSSSSTCLLEVFPGGVRVADKDGVTPLELACEKDLCLNLIYQLVRVDPIMNLRRIGGAAKAAGKRKRKHDSDSS